MKFETCISWNYKSIKALIRQSKGFEPIVLYIFSTLAIVDVAKSSPNTYNPMARERKILQFELSLAMFIFNVFVKNYDINWQKYFGILR